jgi:hypothetical protein
MLGLGDTFLLSSPRNDAEHLWIVLTEPDEHGLSLCVNVTSARDGCDCTVELNPGDHPFIKHRSVIAYFDTRAMLLSDVEAMINMPNKSRVCKQQEPCDRALLEKILKGVLVSKFTPKKARQYLERKPPRA